MSLQFYLYQSKLDHAEGRFLARAAKTPVEGIDTIAAEIANSGLAAGKAEVAAVLAQACEVIERRLIAGRAVRLGGICTLRPTIRGSFDGPETAFEHGRHEVAVSIAAGKRLQKAVRTYARVEKVGPQNAAPVIQEYFDVATQSRNTLYTPGGIGQLTGSRLSFNQSDPEQGLFLESVQLAESLRITTFQKVANREIVFLAPALETGVTQVNFLLKRRTRPAGPLLIARGVTLSIAPA
ncbi:MAG: DUF4469 domain-containing protein [Sedimentisphaerales bacterium]|nr:DUF4469 domain-containing protein [Sedimentisphaerales bacterium]